ncbi:MAG: metal ABC transporter permease [Elusimicrobia bacterium]|nr:metal ABC transporter permease [Elusimicrobiota bacterium]
MSQPVWWLPFHYQFFCRGFEAALLVGALCGVLGVYVVLRGMSYVGHGLAHAIFGGAVIGYALRQQIYVGGALWGCWSALVIHRMARGRPIRLDAAIGIVSAASFALGIALMSRMRVVTRNFEAALFGNLLAVTPFDLRLIVGVAVVGTLLLWVFYKELLFLTFDPEGAQVCGVRVAWIDTLFVLLLAAVIVAALQVIGATLLAAAIVIPAATARLLTTSFHRMVGVAAALGALTAAIGMWASFYLNTASGATVVLSSTVAFGIACVVHFIRRQRLAHQHLHRHGPTAHQHRHIHEQFHHPHDLLPNSKQR